MILAPSNYTSISSRLRSRRRRKTKEHAALQVWMMGVLERELAEPEPLPFYEAPQELPPWWVTP